MVNLNTLGLYKKQIKLTNASTKRVLARLRNPMYFLNMLWILNNSSNDIYDIISKFNPIKQQETLDYINTYIKKYDNNKYHCFLYCVVRAMKPQLVVETGVNEGYSTRAILDAMALNKKGKLYSIDLPNVANAADMRTYNLGNNQPGFVVSKVLRKRWELRLGDSKKLLPQLMNEIGEVDIFLHDSLHTYEHMFFEYSKAWPYIKKNGFIISHDVQMNHAFKKFISTNQEVKFYILDYNVGIVQK